MTNQDERSEPVRDAPPTEQAHDPVEPESRWPRNLGIFGIIYAIIGLSCAGIGTIWMLVSPLLPEMFRGGVEFPPLFRIVNFVTFVLTAVAGILLLTAAVRLIRRRRSGVQLMKAWVVYRLVLVLVAAIAWMMTSQSQIQMARSQYEFRNRMLAESNQPEIPIPDDEALYRRSLYMAVPGLVLQSAVPLFIGFFLSRKRIHEEVSEWP